MLFEGVDSQFIDDSGKTRLLNYETYKVSLLISPLPPLDLKTLRIKKGQDVPVIEAGLDAALEFVRSKDLKIVKKDGNEDEGIQGLWIESKVLNSGIYYGYIPLIPTKETNKANLKDLSKVKYVEVHQNDPIRTDGKENSKLQQYRRSKKIADYLKEYVLYTYAVYVNEGGAPESFGEKSFTIRPDHVYDLDRLDKRLFKDGNDIMYDAKGRLIVTSEGIRTKLISYLNVRLLNDRAGILSLANRTIVTDYYQSISDFRKAPGTLVFTNKKGFERWIDASGTSDKNYVSLALSPEEVEPYFYRSQNIKRGALFIIQNVEDGDIERAKTVSRKWIKDRVNIGYFAEPSKKIADVSHTTYTDLGKVSKKGKVGAAGTADVILYEDGTYGAILFLK